MSACAVCGDGYCAGCDQRPPCADCGRDGVHLTQVSVVEVSPDHVGGDIADIYLCGSCHELYRFEGEERHSEHPARSKAFGGPGHAAKGSVTTRQGEAEANAARLARWEHAARLPRWEHAAELLRGMRANLAAIRAHGLVAECDETLATVRAEIARLRGEP